MPVSLIRGLPNGEEIRVGLRSPWFWTVLLISLFFTAWTQRQSLARGQMRADARFEKRVEEIHQAMADRLRIQELVLRGSAGLLASHDSLDRRTWQSYIRSLRLDQGREGIQAVGYVPRIRAGQKEGLEDRLHAQGFPGFRIWPDDPGAAESAPILFLEPLHDNNRRALGFNLLSDSVRREAMEEARDSAFPTLSGMVTEIEEFPGEPEPQAGFMLFLPIYRTDLPSRSVGERRAALEGYVYSPFRAADLVAGILPDLARRRIGFELFDGRTLRNDSLIFRSENFPSRRLARGSGRFVMEQTLALYGHAWTIRYAADDQFLAEADAGTSRANLILGAAVSLLLAGSVLFLTTTRLRARRLAEQMTSELRALQADLERQVASRTRELEAANKELASEMVRRQAREEQLRQAQKLEAIGRLAGGVAHDFNNLLTAINGYAALCLDGLEPDSPHKSHLEEILRAGEMAASLTRQLLTYSRKQVLAARSVNLKDVVGEAGPLIGGLIGRDITVDFRLASDASWVRVDPSQIKQALMNLVLNARDAMPSGGRLTIETGSETLAEPDQTGLVGEEARAGERAVPPGRYAVLTVRDTGQGMGPETLAHLFEPYFTTKRLGADKGTGLGLSTVFGIVKQSNGYIQVHSEPGLGSVFRILLPEFDEAPTLAESL